MAKFLKRSMTVLAALTVTVGMGVRPAHGVQIAS